jgi:8-oxo-dGTP diphosphatase
VIHVVAGALFDAAGRVLIAERPPGKHMAGHWEFPGGKLAAGEDRFAGLKRELKEELDVDVTSAAPLVTYDHDYADRSVRLDLWRVLRYTGNPLGREGQRLQWVSLQDLDRVGLLEADRPMIAALQTVADPGS